MAGRATNHRDGNPQRCWSQRATDGARHEACHSPRNADGSPPQHARPPAVFHRGYASCTDMRRQQGHRPRDSERLIGASACDHSMPEEMRVAVSDDAELWTIVEGSGPPVVLCHGGPGLWDYLGDLAALLSDEFTVYRWDQRACGRSTAGSLPPSMRRTTDDLDELRTHFGHARWSDLGHSWEPRSLSSTGSSTVPASTDSPTSQAEERRRGGGQRVALNVAPGLATA